MSDPRRYRLTHTTEYSYGDDVAHSYGRAHLVPRTTATQECVSSDVRVEPAPIEQRDHLDYYGNTSTYFAVFSWHRSLRVRSVSEIEVSAPDRSALDSITWTDALAARDSEMRLREFAINSPLARSTPPVASFAAPSFVPGATLGQVVGDLNDRIHAGFRYVSGSTNVRTTLEQLLEQRKGVCQDFAHLAVASLRSAGLAARYVSGYLETNPPPGQPKLQGADATHAWAEVAVPGHGWVGLDPTNNKLVDDGYVVTAWGRDYSDVPPLKGVIVTDAAESKLRVSVDLVRID